MVPQPLHSATGQRRICGGGCGGSVHCCAGNGRVPPRNVEGADGVTAPKTTLHSREFFRRKGLLSEWHPKYEFRNGQLEMAEAVESSLADKKHLIVEAGTGTGKTLAYLIPAILS